MPTVSRKRTRPARDVQAEVELAEANEDLTIPGDWEQEFHARVDSVQGGTDIWDFQSLMPRNGAAECVAYLYRLEPKAFNQAGDGSNINKFQLPVTIETIRARHGGGTYRLWIKRGPRTMRKEVFTIGDCAPIFEPGQSGPGGQPLPGTPAAVQSQKSEMVEVVKLVKDMAQQQNKSGEEATRSAIEISGIGYRNALEIQKSASNSATGNPVADKILNLAIEKLGAEPKTAPSPENPIATASELLKLVREVTSLNAKSSARGDDDEIGFLQKMTTLFGVQSVPELFAKINGTETAKAESPWASLAQMLVAALERLPNIMEKYMQMQEQQLRFQRMKQSQTPGQPPTIPGRAVPLPASTTEIEIPSNGSAPAANGNAAFQPEVLLVMVNGILRAYDEGLDGVIAAIHVKLSIPHEVIQTIRPMFADKDEVAKFIAGIPELAARAVEPDWAPFQAEFLTEMLTDPLPAEEGTDDENKSESAKPPVN